MKRIYCVITAAVMLLCSCSNDIKNSEEKLTYFIPLYANVSKIASNMGELPLFQEVQKQTRIEVTFIHPIPGQELEQLSMLTATDNLPDMLQIDMNKYSGGPQGAIDSQMIADLSSLIENHAPNLKGLLENHPEWDKQVRLANGAYFCFPFIRGDDYLLSWLGWVIRKDWLDILGLGIPETIDEWDTILSRFQQDLGVETPMMLTSLHSKDSLLGAYGSSHDFILSQEGEVVYGPLLPGYREYLALLRRWYSKGYLDKQYFSKDDNFAQANIVAGKSGAAFMNAGSGMGRSLIQGRETTAEFSLVGVPYPTLIKGERPEHGYRDNEINLTLSVLISENSKKKELAARWLDFGYSEKGKMLYNFGIEGKSYRLTEGYPAYTDEVLNNGEGLPPVYAMSRYIAANYGGPFVQDKRYYEQYLSEPEQKNAVAVWGAHSNMRKLPELRFTSEENRVITAVKSKLEDYIMEFEMKIVLGIESLDACDSLKEQLVQLGLDELLSVYRQAYAKYLEK
mgnify:CR=1 FL=1